MNSLLFRSAYRLAILGFALNLLMIIPAHTQSTKGTIRGHVMDPAGDVLQGAQVTIEQSNASISTDAQGDFYIRDLAPGTYAISVTYVGFAPSNRTVDVVAGQVITVEIKLEVASQNEQVLVTAERAAGEAEAINRERSADNVLQVLPADVIRSLPNANLADALGRLPSVTLERDEGEGKYIQVRGTAPRLTNTTIDGMNVPSPNLACGRLSLTPFPPISSSPLR